jgi:amino acid transporter
VQLSALLMLFFEGISVALILILSALVLSQHHFAIDTAQFDVAKLPWSSVGLGVVVAIFSLVGFECATAFGDEAKDPLKTIPRAVMVSLILSGAFFVFVTYVEVLGVRGYSKTLDQLDTPLNTLAMLAHVPILSIPLSIGAMVSFFALNCSCINAGSRVIYAMGRHGIFHEATADSHETNETPHIAVTTMSIISFSLPTLATLHHALLPHHRGGAGLSQAAGRAAPRRPGHGRGRARAVADPDRGQRHSRARAAGQLLPLRLRRLSAGGDWMDLGLPCA